jgi:chromosome segregation ATPase
MTTSTYTKVEIDEKMNQLYKLIMNVMDHVYECDKKVDEKIKKCNQQVYRMNEIAEVINEGIYMLNERLDGMTEKTDKINKKLDETIPYKISEMNAKMLEIDQKFDYMDEKIAERLDEHIEDTDDKITEKLNEIYDNCNKKLDELDENINTHEELINKITWLETQFQESKDKITGLETEINILNTHNTNINDQLINFKELITDHVTHTELEQTVNRCVAFQHLSTASNREFNPCNSDISMNGWNTSTKLNFKRPVLYYPNDNPNHGLQNLHENNYYLRTIKCNGIYYNFIPHNGYIFNSNSEKIDRGDSSYRPAGKYDLKTHSIQLFNFKV